MPETIDTARLTLRRPNLADVPDLVAAVHESLAELSPWLVWASAKYDAAGCEANLRGAIADFVLQREFRYHLFAKESGLLVGVCGLQNIDWTVPKLEVGYWLRSSFVGQGLMSEAVRTLSAQAGEGLEPARLEIRTDERNHRSAQVAERCGYRLEGTLKHDGRDPNGVLRSTRIYALTDLPS